MKSSITKRRSKDGVSITFKGPIANTFAKLLMEKLDPPPSESPRPETPPSDPSPPNNNSVAG